MFLYLSLEKKGPTKLTEFAQKLLMCPLYVMSLFHHESSWEITRCPGMSRNGRVWTLTLSRLKGLALSETAHLICHDWIVGICGHERLLMV